MKSQMLMIVGSILEGAPVRLLLWEITSVAPRDSYLNIALPLGPLRHDTIFNSRRIA